MSVKLCINCHHCDAFVPILPRCRCPQNDAGDVVTGEYTARWNMCDTHRTVGWLESRVFGLCGKEGRWFQGKD